MCSIERGLGSKVACGVIECHSGEKEEEKEWAEKEREEKKEKKVGKKEEMDKLREKVSNTRVLDRGLSSLWGD